MRNTLKNWMHGRQAKQRSADLMCDMPLLRDNLPAWQSGYVAAKPFSHIVIDDFIAESTLQQLLKDFPAADQPMLRRSRTAQLEDGRMAQMNKRSYSDQEVGPAVRQMLWELNSGAFIGWLEALTGIPDLLPDPSFNGAGVHVTDPGGLLRVHADYNKHPRYGLDRRINLLLYLNEGWRDDYGGHLELWDSEMAQCWSRVLPIARRCVIFSTTSTSFHGHPHPLTCPPGMSRKSIALYYYTNGRPEAESNPGHATLWQDLPAEK